MRRKLFTSAALLSIIIMIVIGSMWVRSYWAQDRLSLRKNTFNFWDVRVLDGAFILARSSEADHLETDDELEYHVILDVSIKDGFWGGLTLYSDRSELDSHWSILGFEYGRNENAVDLFGRGEYRVAEIRFFSTPMWFVCSIFAVLPLVWVFKDARHRRQHARAARGMCRKCGYDLRHNQVASCPECGATRWLD